jgi:hypothetical protein
VEIKEALETPFGNEENSANAMLINSRKYVES